MRAWQRVRAHTWAPSRAEVRHATLAVRTLGDSGTPVVLLHGLAASGRMWGAAFDQLSTRHHVIAPDLLGFGASPKPPRRAPSSPRPVAASPP